MYDNSLSLLTVSKQWYNILADINNLTTFSLDQLGMKQICDALRINRAIIRENTIAQYFPYFKMDHDLSPYTHVAYINIFYIAYHKVSWQHMRIPTLVESEEYLRSNMFHRCMEHTQLLLKCRRPDSFFYLHHIVDTNFYFWNVLDHVATSVSLGYFELKHVNWLIKLYHAKAQRLNMAKRLNMAICDQEIELRPNVLRKLVEINYPARRIRLFFDKLDNMIDRTLISNPTQRTKILQAIIIAYSGKKAHHEIAYYESLL